MREPNALRALPPVWFRFTDEEDQGKYGNRWFKYDEGAILRKRARDQVALETDLGMPLVSVMNGFRDSTTLGDLAVAWLGVHETDPARAGDFDDFNPVTGLIQWSGDDPEPGPKDEEPEPTPPPEDNGYPTAGSSGNMTSAMTATVALPVMPTVEFRTS